MLIQLCHNENVCALKPKPPSETRQKVRRWQASVLIKDGNIPISEFFSKGDPYVKVFLESTLIGKTKVVRNEQNPVFNEKMPVANVTRNDAFILEVKNDNRLGRNKVYCRISIPIIGLLSQQAISDVINTYKCGEGWLRVQVDLTPN